MSRLSTVATATVRLLLAATIVASAAPLSSHANLAGATGEALTETDAPALPSSFNGTDTLDGVDLAEAANSRLS